MTALPAFLAEHPAESTFGQLDELLELARWAPSGDNTQPWRIRQVLGSLEILMQSQASFLDVGWSASHIALGAFAESCQLAAGRLGFSSELGLMAGHNRQVCATLALGAGGGAQADPLAMHLERRGTNRRPYKAGSCSNEELSLLAAAAELVPGVEIRIIDGKVLHAVARAVGLADRVRMEHCLCHQQLHKKIRWTGASEEHPTGFHVGTFELKAPERWLLRISRPMGVMKLFNIVFRMSTVAGALTRRLVMSSGAVGVIRTAGWSGRQLMQTGRALQRTWLQATALGLSFQVLGGRGTDVSAAVGRRCERLQPGATTKAGAVPPPARVGALDGLGRRDRLDVSRGSCRGAQRTYGPPGANADPGERSRR